MAIAVPNTVNDCVESNVVATPGDVSFTTPSNVVSGDVLLALIFVDVASPYDATTTITPPGTGWVEIVSRLDAATLNNPPLGAVYYKVLSSAPDATYAFAVTDPVGTANSACGLLLRVTGANTSTVLDGTASITTTTNTTAPNSGSITTTVDGSVVFSFVGGATSTVATAEDSNGPSGYTVAMLRNFNTTGTTPAIGIAYKTVATAGAEDPGAWTSVWSTSIFNTVGTFAVQPAGASAVTISDVDTDETITATQTNVAVTGTGFGASQGAGSVKLIDGALDSAQTIDSWSDTLIQFDTVLGNVRYGGRTLRVTNNSAATGDLAVTITAPSGKSYVDLTTPNTTADNRITAAPDLASGDQLEISNVVGGTISDVTVNADATFDCATSVTAFDVRAHDGATGWGAIGTQSVSAASGATTSSDGRLRVYVLSSGTGLRRWVDYLPAKFAAPSGRLDSYDDGGAISVEVISSTYGLQAWVDYVPVVEVTDDASGKFTYNDAGWIQMYDAG